jgi:hypothetical protein
VTPSGPSAGDLLALLDRERAAFLASVERVPLARQTERPSPDRWSVAEIVEHIARIDTGVAKVLAMKSAEPLTAGPEELAGASMTPEKAARIRGRNERVEAPDRVRPSGTLTAEAAMTQLAHARAGLKGALLEADPAALDGAAHPHILLGPLTLRAWVEFAAHHDARHAQQVAELADLWYPNL